MLFPTFLGEKNLVIKKKCKKNNSFSFNVFFCVFFYARSISNLFILIFDPKGDGWWWGGG